jgi:hypothetical protein
MKTPPPKPLDIAPRAPRLCPRGCGVRLYGESDAHACSKAPDAVVSELARDAEKRAPISTDRDKAARWTLFAAHALQGLLANPALDGEGAAPPDWAADAAEYADAALAEHQQRFDVFAKKP